MSIQILNNVGLFENLHNNFKLFYILSFLFKSVSFINFLSKCKEKTMQAGIYSKTSKLSFLKKKNFKLSILPNAISI